MAGEQGCEIRGDLAHNVMKSEQGCEYLGDLAHNVMKSEQGCEFSGDLAHNVMEGEQGCEFSGDLAHNMMKSEQGCEFSGDLAHNMTKSEQGCEIPGDLAHNVTKSEQGCEIPGDLAHNMMKVSKIANFQVILLKITAKKAESISGFRFRLKSLIYAFLLPFNIPKMNDTTRIKIIAPTSVPMTLMPPIVGPKSKPSALPIDPPMIPAKTLPIIPNGISLLTIKPASQPKIPPTIIVHNQPILITS